MESFTQNLQEFPSLPSCPCASKVAAFRLGVAVVVRLEGEHQLKYHLPGGPSFTRVGWISYWIGLSPIFVPLWIFGYLENWIHKTCPSFSVLSCCVLEYGRFRISSMGGLTSPSTLVTAERAFSSSGITGTDW